MRRASPGLTESDLAVVSAVLLARALSDPEVCGMVMFGIACSNRPVAAAQPSGSP